MEWQNYEEIQFQFQFVYSQPIRIEAENYEEMET